MDVYYHVKFQLCITSGSKVSRGVQNCNTPRNSMWSDPRNRFKALDNFMAVRYNQSLISFNKVIAKFSKIFGSRESLCPPNFFSYH